MISTHTPLAGRDKAEGNPMQLPLISTHTPLAGRDNFDMRYFILKMDFYSHAPCGT